MAKFVSLLIVILCLSNGLQYITCQEKDANQDYNNVSAASYGGQNCRKGIYWREWKFAIPSDAIIGGYINNQPGVRRPIYMGQAYVRQNPTAGLQPGQLFSDSLALTTTYGGIRDNTESVKILCGNQNDVTWVPVNQTIFLNPASDFVIAGFEKDFQTYFGRTVYSGRMIIGKYVLSGYNLMAIRVGTKEMYFYDNFEVLCYTKNARDKLMMLTKRK